jgi:glycosyltransferase involved in cell wall biosynthesis
MKFGILTISYRRQKILHLFLASIKRLRNDCGYFPCIVVGDEEHKGLCEAYEVFHVTQENHPATAKWNTGVDYLMGIGCDYIVITGSDDIVSTPLMLNLISEMEKGTDLVGISTIYFYASDGKHKGSLRKLTANKQILGVARCISRNVIEKTGLPLWNKESSWGMDGICLRNIRPHVKTMKIVEGVCVDVKNNESLNKFTFWLSRIHTESPPEIFYSILSDEEKQILSEI